MMVGFVHGVMNTDNTAISGETIDYGPCAFMEEPAGPRRLVRSTGRDRMRTEINRALRSEPDASG